MNLTLMINGKDKEDKRKELSGRRLVYLAETDLKFDTKVPIMQKIEIQGKEIDAIKQHTLR